MCGCSVLVCSCSAIAQTVSWFVALILHMLATCGQPVIFSLDTLVACNILIKLS